ncbi:MAG TPA: hypothetical protein VGB82_02200 [Alphaproteobacteria bacterium]
MIERADRSPPEIDLAPSEWEEVRDWTGTAAPEDRRVGARRIGSFWILATILLLAIAAGPALAAITHHIG